MQANVDLIYMIKIQNEIPVTWIIHYAKNIFLTYMKFSFENIDCCYWGAATFFPIFRFRKWEIIIEVQPNSYFHVLKR